MARMFEQSCYYMDYLKKAFNDKLFLQINHLLWAVPFFFLAIWMSLDFKRLIEEPLQLIGLILLVYIGFIFVKKGLSNDIKSLKFSRAAPVSDIFFFLFALISFFPAVAIWEIIKIFNKEEDKSGHCDI